MRGILVAISRALDKDPNYRADCLKYLLLKEHDGWPIHQKLLLTMRGMIADELLSTRFTKLDEREKDVRQLAYHQVNEVIGFLLNPLEKAIKKAEFEQNYEREMRNRMGAPTGRNR